MLSDDQNVSRRTFVKQGMGAVIAAAAAPAILRAEDKTMSQTKTIGEGRYKYEVVPNWGQVKLVIVAPAAPWHPAPIEFDMVVTPNRSFNCS